MASSITEPLSFFFFCSCSGILFKSLSGGKCTFLKNLNCLSWCIQNRKEVMRSRGDTELPPEFQVDLEAEFHVIHEK